jgi:Peptidase family S51
VDFAALAMISIVRCSDSYYLVIMMETKQQVIAMGGGGFSMEPENLLLDRYIIQQARKPGPSVCFFPHATDDATRNSFRFFKTFAQLDANPTHLSLISSRPHAKVYQVGMIDNQVLEKTIETRYLGD